MSDDNKLYKLTRRKALAGLGTIGVAGAAAGMGTSALFSDEEGFEDNILTAGTLNLGVTGEIVAANEYYTSSGDGPDILGQFDVADGEVVTGIQAGDVKPGDWVIICFQICIWDNPGYVQITTDPDSDTSTLTNSDNGITEPEDQVNSQDNSLDQSDGTSDGDLQDEMVAEIYGSYDDMSSPTGPRTNLSDLASNQSGGESVQEVYDLYKDGVTLTGPETAQDPDPLEVGGDSDDYNWDPDSDGLPIDDSNFSDAAGALCVDRYLLLYLPSDVGNIVQGDSFKFDLGFEAEQVRNNSTPFDN